MSFQRFTRWFCDVEEVRCENSELVEGYTLDESLENLTKLGWVHPADAKFHRCVLCPAHAQSQSYARKEFVNPNPEVKSA